MEIIDQTYGPLLYWSSSFRKAFYNNNIQLSIITVNIPYTSKTQIHYRMNDRKEEDATSDEDALRKAEDQKWVQILRRQPRIPPLPPIPRLPTRSRVPKSGSQQLQQSPRHQEDSHHHQSDPTDFAFENYPLLVKAHSWTR
jgi:hypothetical protein